MGDVVLVLVKRSLDQLLLDPGGRSADDGLHPGVVVSDRLFIISAERIGQVPNGQLLTVGEEHRPLDDVLEFADIARPGVGEESTERLGRDVTDLSTELRVEPSDVVVNKGQQILETIEQRKQPMTRDVERIE